MYSLPDAVLDQIRKTLLKGYNIRFEGSSQVCLFTYDNGSFVLHSFLPYKTQVKVIVNKQEAKLRDLMTGKIEKSISLQSYSEFILQLKPHSNRVMAIE